MQIASLMLFGPIEASLPRLLLTRIGRGSRNRTRMDWLRASYSAIELYPRHWYPLAELNRPLTAYRAAFLPLEEAGMNWWAGEESNLASEERGFTDRLRNLALYRPGASTR